MAIRVSSSITLRWLVVYADSGGHADWPWTCVDSLATCIASSGALGCCLSSSTGSICYFVTTCIVSLSMRSGGSRGVSANGRRFQGAVEQSSCGTLCLSDRRIRKW